MTSQGPLIVCLLPPSPLGQPLLQYIIVLVSLALSLCYMLLSSDANNFTKGTLLATPCGTPAFPQAFMVIFSTG